ncbi:MAG: hypothetical protein VB949_00410 [Pseudomonadales bacterium]|jgi:hypothetical protein
MKIEPLKGWFRYTELMDQQSDPRGKAMLDNMRHHLKYECLGNPEIFATMVPDPEYRFYGSFDNSVLKGMPEIKNFYQNIWDGRTSLVELKIHRCAVADWGVACDGEWYQQVPGETLIAGGQDVSDPDAWYLSHAHLSWFFPFREVDGAMLLEGEICYIDDAGSTLEVIGAGDVLSVDEASASWAAL